MKKREYQKAVDKLIPETPDVFSQAMKSSLDFIVAHAPEEESKPVRILSKRRTVALVLAVVLLLAAVAYAATHWETFETLRYMTGASPTHADEVMQRDLYVTTVNGVEISIKEAGYDGRTLFIRYSYRMTDVDTCLGTFAEEYKGTPDYGMEGIGEEDLQLLADHHVGWWIDHLWINGKSVDMPANSGAATSGSEVPGELVQTEYWRLDNENVQLSGKVDVSLPIGEKQTLADYYSKEHPEKYDADGSLLLPDKGVVTFTVDTSDTLARVKVEHPDVPLTTDLVTAQVSEVCYSPLMTYITLKLEGNPEAIAAYKQENGEGFYSEDGKTLLWPYDGQDVFGEWVCALELVDAQGKQLFPDTYGNNGCGNDWAEFNYPYIEHIPDALYLAPIRDGVADMTQAVKVR